MRRRVVCLVFGLLVVCAAGVVAAGSLAYRPGEVLVVLRDDSPLTLAADGKAVATDGEVARVLVRHGLTRGAPTVAKTGALSVRDRRFLTLRSDRADCDPAAAARELLATGRVAAACPNFVLRLFATPNDPRLGEQWHLASGSAGVALPAAWDITTGAATAVIAIMDTGVDLGHPDLAGKIWQNAGEVAGNGLDDDGNGYVDDVHGWDFGQNDNDPNPHVTPDATGIDVGFHGTHCAGIAGAATNNALGVAGVAWACPIMPLKVVDSAGEFTTDALTGAFLYAAAMGADVVSMSFGGPDEAGFAGFVQQLVNEAIAAETICVAAAGNDGTSDRLYPAACDSVISVGATDETGGRASFSSWGEWVDVAAPGQQILSTMCRNYEFDFLTQLLYILLLGWDGTEYILLDGTSMACPLVAGVCGLVRSVAPGISPQQMANLLVSTGDSVPFDYPLGVKLNARAAVGAAALVAAPDVAPSARLRLAAHPNPFNPRVVIGYDLPRAGRLLVEVYDARGRLVAILCDTERPAGAGEVVWDGLDGASAPVPSGVYLARASGCGLSAACKLVVAR